MVLATRVIRSTIGRYAGRVAGPIVPYNPGRAARYAARRGLAATLLPWRCARAPTVLLATGRATDLVRRRNDRLLENAFLRRRVIALSRTAERPMFISWGRALLVLFAGRLRTWVGTLPLSQPATVLRRHRQGFRLVRPRKSAPRTQPSPTATAIIKLIERMAGDNPLWGAERIREELLRRSIRLSKRTIQKYVRQVPRSRPLGQAWATFLRNHAHETWACDSLHATNRMRQKSDKGWRKRSRSGNVAS